MAKRFSRTVVTAVDAASIMGIRVGEGRLQVGDREMRVRAIRARSERVRDAVDEAYAAKYTTKASQKYVRGFRTPRRRDATMEFVPR
jgi:hypothetical protein